MKCYKYAAEEGKNAEAEGGIGKHQQHAGAHAAVNAVELHRAIVLPAVDGHGRAGGVERAGEELADLVCCGDGCDGDRAEAIHGRLHDDGADGGDGILQAHRHAPFSRRKSGEGS